MSAYVKKIQFKLHESYGNPLRGEQSVNIQMQMDLEEIRTCISADVGLNYFHWQCVQLFLLILVVTKPPYEITETGWGEFEIIIKIFFIDPNERPVRA